MTPSEEVRRRAVRRLRAAGCVFAELEFDVLWREAADLDAFESMLRRRTDGEPLEAVVGVVEFCGLRVPVHPGVFVPRARSEHLVETAIGLLRPGDDVLDLGCGTGALALVLASTRYPGSVTACDVDPAACANARETLHGWGAQVWCGDLFAAVPADARFDLVAANLPYVPTAEVAHLPREARGYEPAVALDGGSDGLDVLRRGAAELSVRLRSGGSFLIEVSEPQADIAEGVLAGVGLAVTRTQDPDTGTCVVVARLPEF